MSMDSKDRLSDLRPEDHAYFQALENRVSQAHFEFCEYRDLFYESDSVDTLNATAPYFFPLSSVPLFRQYSRRFAGYATQPLLGRKRTFHSQA